MATQGRHVKAEGRKAVRFNVHTYGLAYDLMVFSTGQQTLKEFGNALLKPIDHLRLRQFHLAICYFSIFAAEPIGADSFGIVGRGPLPVIAIRNFWTRYDEYCAAAHIFRYGTVL